MTRPDEIAALADEDELADFIYQVQDYSHAKRKAAMLWPLVRLSATSPGDAVREALERMLGGKCPQCNGWGEIAHMGEMVQCSCAGNYRYQPTDADREFAKAALATAAKPEDELVLQWRYGAPPKPWCDEWFIAETTFRDRVVLTALPEEYSYDFKTADDTYIKADKIKRWMQFPDSHFIAPATPTPPSANVAKATWEDRFETGDADHQRAIQSAATGGGTEGGEE